jgi:hypothetical protein
MSTPFSYEKYTGKALTDRINAVFSAFGGNVTSAITIRLSLIVLAVCLSSSVCYGIEPGYYNYSRVTSPGKELLAAYDESDLRILIRGLDDLYELDGPYAHKKLFEGGVTRAEFMKVLKKSKPKNCIIMSTWSSPAERTKFEAYRKELLKFVDKLPCKRVLVYTEEAPGFRIFRDTINRQKTTGSYGDN